MCKSILGLHKRSQVTATRSELGRYPLGIDIVTITRGPGALTLYLLYDQWFPRYRTFYNSPLTTMLNGQKRTKKMPKIQYFKFYYSFNNFGRDPR